MPEYYVVIVETKQEKPLVWESYLLDYEKASERMKSMASNPDVIRVAVAKLVYENGNETLFK